MHHSNEKRLYGFFGLLILGTVVWILCAFFAPAHFFGAAQKVLFRVNGGDDLAALADHLEAAELVRSSRAFTTLARMRGDDVKIQPGRYQLSTDLTPRQILATLTDTKRSTTKITIPEGYSVFDIDARLVENGLSDAGDFTRQAQSYEGFLFPDTYIVYSTNFASKDLISKMQNTFTARVNGALIEAEAKEGHSLKELITMASILEKEVRTEKDLPVVAGIFWKRLKNNWAMQADATLLYGKKIRTITAEDLSDETNPYNTYKNKGLPPTPINNPGLAAITAAAHPEDSPYWYYLTDGEGAVHYAKTNEEHNENRRKYLQ